MRPPASRVLMNGVAALQAIAMIGLALALAGCGGSSTATTVSTNYTVGGTISGLAVSSVVLANGTATVTVSAGATSWVFPSSFVAGSSYSVTVKTQPVGELCGVTSGGSGMNTGSVGDVAVVCSFGQWTWEGGVSAVNASAIYGTQGVASSSNVPGARYSASTWTDASGNFWLFGGIGYDSTSATGYLNDLWQYTPSTKEWNWVNGGMAANASGVYGMLGTAAASNVPGARYAASSWIDASGNLWLFGGIGHDSTGAVGNLNDLWRYTPATGQWTWIAGAGVANAGGVYGTQGTAAASNVPGARYAASSWIDASGNLWLFAGVGDDSTGSVGNLNDLWRYNPGNGQWTWVAGANVANASGSYGAQGTAAASNAPGARYAASSWMDASGTLWLFGGYGYDSTGTAGKLNDLWQYSSSGGQWTWVGGSSEVNATAIYGTLGAALVGTEPGARQAASSWIDSAGNLWLFGGVGYDLAGGVGNLNDLWRYSPSTNEWAWVSGSSADNASGIYGTQGTAAVNSVPGGRNAVSSWIDSAGNLWLFGGYGYGSIGAVGYLNDLWQYNPNAGT
jgi:N-acetylneuraminic acid mutarotase